MTIANPAFCDHRVMPATCLKLPTNEQVSFSTCIAPKLSLLSLPEDVILLILTNLDVKAIVQLRQTSKRFLSVTKIRWVWLNALKRHVIAKGLPLPAPDADLRTLSSDHLEARTIHAAKFHENWYSGHPKPRRAIEFQPFDTPCVNDVDAEGFVRPAKVAVTQVLFLPGRNGEFIMTAVGKVITCWEVPLDGSGTYRIAEWKSHGDIEEMIVNEDPKHHIHVVCLTPDPMSPPSRFMRFVALSLDAFHGVLVPISGLRMLREEAAPMHSMCGDWMAFGNDLTVCSFFVKGKCPMTVNILGNLADPELRSDVLEVKFVGDHLLVVRETSLQLIRYRSTDIARRSTHVVFDGIAKDAAIFARKRHAGPISVLLRTYDDGFDTIRQYDIEANPKWREDSEGVDAGFPYVLPEQYTRVHSVAPSACDLRVGPNGIGFWIQTQNVTAKRSIFPARCLVGFDLTYSPPMVEEASRQQEEDGEERNQEDARRKEGKESYKATEMYKCQKEVYARRCDMSEIISRRYALMCADIEDAVGRIVIGYRRGWVEVLDYV